MEAAAVTTSKLIRIEDIARKFCESLPPDKQLYGRILRGRSESDFITMSDTPESRFIVLISDFNGLMQFNGLPGISALNIIGYPPEYIYELRLQGYQFKLLMFEDTASNVHPATWDNLCDIVCEVYPKVANKVQTQLPLLKSLSYHQICDRSYQQIRRNFTYKELQKVEGTTCHVRLFLEDTVNINPLFAGDGWTRNCHGQKEIREYFLLNRPLNELSRYELVDIEV
jgi:hypothetical protein